MPLAAESILADDWHDILNDVTSALQPYIRELAAAGLPLPSAIPEVEHFNDQIDDDAFAELAWPQCQPPIALLAGEQIEFASKWQDQGWHVITPDEMQAKGTSYLIDQIANGLVGVEQS